MILGIDIGGSGIKGGLVDINTGELKTERHRIETPPDAKPEDIAEIIAQITQHFNYKGVIGCGFPSVVQNGIVKTAANINKENIETNVNELFSKATGQEVFVFNDADAAGVAEILYGAGKGVKGVVLLFTIGTGIGSALFIDGKLVPNTEFGHVFMKKGIIGEKYCSDSTRKLKYLEWIDWGKRFNKYLRMMEKLINPDLIIIGGGVSSKMELFEDAINIKTIYLPAQLLNNAGIIGAAALASKSESS